MKKKIQHNLAIVLVLSMSISLILYYALQIQLMHKEITSNSRNLLLQIERILADNQREAEAVTGEFRQGCMEKAKAAAYIVENHPEIMYNLAETKKVAKILAVDELHFFNTEGTIIAGSEPKYYGYNFNSGEQMRFFLPLLNKETQAMCQPITPNTAEGKMMQYAAVWREDGKGIVQIGIEPDRVLDVTKKNELSYIFSLLTTEDYSTIYAVDAKTFEILGSTENTYVGKTLDALGIDEKKAANVESSFHGEIDGERHYIVFINDKKDGVLLGRSVDSAGIYADIAGDTCLLALYLILLAMIMYYVISRYLDKNIIQGISEINAKLKRISNGNLSEKVDVDKTPEFEQLSGHINLMVNTLLESADKLSSVLDMAEIKIGMFEYSKDKGKMIVTSEFWEILEVEEADRETMSVDFAAFDQGINRRLKSAVEGEEDIFQMNGDKAKYIKLKVFIREESVFGLLMDVTRDVEERKRIERERDEDTLTGLYERRAFRARAAACISEPETMQYGAILVMDADNLKAVNDRYGHLAGDKYLCKIAEVISSCSAPFQYTARMSGDEFIQLIYGCETETELRRYVQEVLDSQSGYEVKITDSVVLPVSFSAGYSIYPLESTEYSVLTKIADERMYKNKRKKKSSRCNTSL